VWPSGTKGLNTKNKETVKSSLEQKIDTTKNRANPAGKRCLKSNRALLFPAGKNLLKVRKITLEQR